jgi:hypothetical protein
MLWVSTDFKVAQVWSALLCADFEFPLITRFALLCFALPGLRVPNDFKVKVFLGFQLWSALLCTISVLQWVFQAFLVCSALPCSALSMCFHCPTEHNKPKQNSLESNCSSRAAQLRSQSTAE